MSKAQVLAILGALFLFVLLLFAATKPSKMVKEKATDVSVEESFEDIIAEAENALAGISKAQINEWTTALDHATHEQKISFSDSLSKMWESLKRPDVAAYYAEQKALIGNSPELWNKAGERYYNAVRFLKTEQQSALYKNAIRCFEKALSFAPTNLDAKTNLGACYVEGTAEPMKGISLLLEVVAKDSAHINAQITLAFFSMKSGQTDKAIDRFNKVLAIDSNYVEAYLFLADVYEQSGKKKEAVAMLEQYAKRVDDVTVKNEITNYINKLKQS